MKILKTDAKQNGHKPDACDAHAATGRKAAGVDAAIKQANLTRLKRIEGQVRGIAKMVEEDRYCRDVLTQVAAVQQALRSVARELVRNHLTHCVPAAIAKGDARCMADELAEIFHGLTK